jgi:hypothetical protein
MSVALVEVRGAVFVHQETDGAAVHAVDRLAVMHVLMQRLQHQAVAAERDHDIGLRSGMIAVELRQLLKCLLGFLAGTGDEGDPVIALGRGHGIAYSCWRRYGCLRRSSIRPDPSLSR